VRIDGKTAAKECIAGKPEPDTFLAAAKKMGIEPERIVVFEDAISGVQAGVKGAFSLVVGVDREGHCEELKAAGASIVVNDLEKLIPENSV
jgi:beta-phosphoglucomutase-like phosphatase (HAD superfamily)